METGESREKAADDTVSEPHEDPDKADRIAGATSDASVAIDEIPGLAHPPAAGGPAGPPVPEGLKAIVEALVFASPEPLTPKALFKLLDGEPREEVERALDALKADYAAARGLQIVEIAGGLQIVTRTDLHEWVRRLFRERRTTKLSLPALETLAVVAYRQPVTAAEIAEIRGVNTAGVLGTLMERKLVKIAGRKPVVGRPFLYATTREFLIRFGLNDLADLPKVEEMADALGFDLPGMAEAGPTDQYLPLDQPGGDLEAGPPAEEGSGGAAGTAPGPADPSGDPPAR